MLTRLLLFVIVFGCVFAAQYKCKNKYEPKNYVNEVRVPTDCKLENLNCPRSWKNGIAKGGETDLPMVDHLFLNCHEGFLACGYVPINNKNGEVLGHSGVTIGAGVDLGSKARSDFSSVRPQTIVDKLEQYFGLKKNDAACAVIELPLQLTVKQAQNVTFAIKNVVINEVEMEYNSKIKGHKTSKPFASLPRGIRTAIVSVWYQFGPPDGYPNFWKTVTRNDWKAAVKELRNFYSEPEKQQRGSLQRRNNEADIIEATLSNCSRSVDVVFLLDESGSVSSASFNESLKFVQNLVKAFPDDKLKGKDGTRFGLSTFSRSYKSHFYLSNYTSRSSYLAAINNVPKRGGGTKLGSALRQILVDQFTEARGLRPEVDGLPRILIVLTDGKSYDQISTPARNVRNENIVIYAIGIGGYYLSQLKQIASSDTHVYTLSTFSELTKFIATITASTCYEPRPASQMEQIKTTVSKDTYQYFSYNVNKSSNLMIQIVDLFGSTFVYASRTNPHPYKYDHDIAFDLSKQKNKVIIISATFTAAPQRAKRSTKGLTKQIYVAVTANTDSAEFTIEGSECNPMNCTEGTNEIPPPTEPSTTSFTAASKLVVASLCILMIFS